MNTINLLSDARFFDESNTKLAELRAQLDLRVLKDKLDAMKALLAMMTLGRDVSAFFPDVVKNVVVESQEVKKLVYMFLITYSEQKQDLALLSINTFQKDLQSPSQRIRANAMKAMSSIRIPIATPLIMLALKAAVKDASSYVKRAAACAIPKVHSQDAEGEQTEALVEMVAELLSSIEPIVLGSALFAFHSVCPTRWDLLHAHYRKVCHLLADFDEWGQVVALQVLLRYGRTQFISPYAQEKTAQPSNGVARDRAARNDRAAAKSSKDAGDSGGRAKEKRKKKKRSTAFYSDEEESEEDDDASTSDSVSERSDVDSSAPPTVVLDEDHALLLRQSQSLLQSANSAVILSIATLHWYLAPSSLCALTIPPLVRLSRNKRSIQYVLLTNVLTMAKTRPTLFAPHLKDFYVHQADAAYVKSLKLDVLSCIVDDSTVVGVVKELAVYVLDVDKAFVCEAIQCLGRCSVRLQQVADRAMAILMRLVTSSHDAVVAQAVVTIRALLQSHAELPAAVVKRMVRLLPKVRIPMARTSIVWMVGEYRDCIPTSAPDCLRLLAQSFRDEDDLVKTQVLNLAVKLFLSNPRQTSTLFKYVMDLCKYDVNYDIRDRARLMRALFFKKKDAAASAAPPGTEVKEALKGLFLVAKPASEVDDRLSGHDRFLLGTMSHSLGVQVSGYGELPEFPLIAPSGDPRKPREEFVEERAGRGKRAGGRGNESGGSGSEEASGSEESAFSEFDSEGSAASRSRSRSRSESGSDRSDSDEAARRRPKKSKGKDNRKTSSRRRGGDSDSRSDSRSDSERSDSDRSDSRSDSRSGSDSDAAARKRKRDEKEKEQRSRAREREKENEREKERREKERKDKEKDKGGKGRDAAVDRPEKDKHKAEDKKPGKPAPPAPSADLLDLNDLADVAPSTLPTSHQPLIPATASPSISSPPTSSPASPQSAAVAFPSLSYPSRGQRGQLLNPITSSGLRIDYAFSRRPSLYGPRLIDLELTLLNESTAPFRSLALEEEEKALEADSEGLDDVAAVGELGVGDVRTVKVHVDFKGKIQPRVWRVSAGDGDYAVKLTPDVGELVRPSLIGWREWEAKAKRLSGMSEHRVEVRVGDAGLRRLAQAIVEVANVAVLGEGEEGRVGEGGDGGGVLRMSGLRMHDDSWVLLRLAVMRRDDKGGRGGVVAVTVHCEDFLFATNLADLAKKTLI